MSSRPLNFLATKTLFIGLLVSLCLLSIHSNLFAQAPEKPDIKESTGLRIPSDERLEEIHNDPEFDYHQELQEPGLWQRFLMWLMNKLAEWLDINMVRIFLKVVSVLAIILVILLFINQITEGQLKNALTRRRNRTLLDLRHNGKVMSLTNLDSLIEQAIAGQQYALAVRYLYQKSLHTLRNEELITWKKDKTNHEYLYELGNHPAASYFDRLTYYYEYVDYGDFPIEEKAYLRIQEVFNQFIAHIGKKA